MDERKTFHYKCAWLLFVSLTCESMCVYVCVFVCKYVWFSYKWGCVCARVCQIYKFCCDLVVTNANRTLLGQWDVSYVWYEMDFIILIDYCEEHLW